MKRVLFYITGHGFGHATRIIKVINELSASAKNVLPVINTAVPKWLFDQQVTADFEYVLCENDIGAIQKDWRRVDKLETLKQYSQFMETESAFTAEQLDFVKQNKVTAIVTDIPASALLIAHKAGVSGFGITNFSWDWIYAPYVEEYPQYRFVVDHIRKCYGLADCLLRLPFYGDTSAFPVVEDIPLIATQSTLKRDKAVGQLGIDANKKIVLLYLGNFDYGRILSDEILRRQDYYFMPPEMCKNSHLPFQDLLNAADVVLTKPGYGMVSECIANQTPIMYTDREDFQEYEPLVAGISKYAHNSFVTQEDLFNGNWFEQIGHLLMTEYNWPKIAINGAQVAAKKILESI